MHKLKVLGKVIESGLVAIVRTRSPELATRIAEACARGGAAAIEITFTVPGAAAVIEHLAEEYKSGEILIRRRRALPFWLAPSTSSVRR
jgi:2-dehydro-3-deoxyphosphogluconate aldolase/(4S)-4-hydroxy-2-oxoglutarate aldolase